MIINVPKRLALVAGMLTIGLGPGLSPAVLATENDNGFWTVFPSTDSFPARDSASRWHYSFDAQARYFDLGSGINQCLGLGLASTRSASRFRQAELDDVTSAEAFLRIPVGDGSAQITPSIQYVENPGFDTSGATLSSSAFVAGVRFHLLFAK